MTQGTEMQMRDICAVSAINVLWAAVSDMRFEQSDERINHLFQLFATFFSSLDITGGILNQMPLIRFIAPEKSGYNNIKNAVTALQEYLKVRQ